MLSVQKTDFGVKMVMGGFIPKSEMDQFVNDSVALLPLLKPPFGVFVDMRDLKPLPPESQSAITAVQAQYKAHGGDKLRSVVILKGALLTMQFRRLAKETGVDKWERYIDADKTSDWESVGLKWLKDGTEPNS